MTRNMSLRVSIRSIAQKAGVSANTVSLALKNSPRLQTKTREHIHKIAQQLGYRINPFISAFMSDLKRSKTANQSIITLAYLAGTRLSKNSTKEWNPEENLRHPETRNGALERAKQLNYKLETFYWDQPGMTGERLTKILHTRNIKGIIVGPHSPHIDLSIDWSLFSVIATGHSLSNACMDRVASDIYSNTLLAWDKLRQLGYQRIGLITPLQGDLAVDQRVSAAYLARQQLLNKTRTPIPPLFMDSLELKNFFKWHKQYSPDAIITYPIDLVRPLKKIGSDLPGKIGFACLNIQPDDAISGVDPKTRLIGATSVEMLEGQLVRNERGLPAHPKLILVPGQWVEGSTTRQQ